MRWDSPAGAFSGLSSLNQRCWLFSAGSLDVCGVPLHGISTGTANFTTFSEVLFNFRITPKILLDGMVFASFVGILGGVLPARRASQVTLMEALQM